MFLGPMWSSPGYGLMGIVLVDCGFGLQLIDCGCETLRDVT